MSRADHERSLEHEISLVRHWARPVDLMIHLFIHTCGCLGVEPVGPPFLSLTSQIKEMIRWERPRAKFRVVTIGWVGWPVPRLYLCLIPCNCAGYKTTTAHANCRYLILLDRYVVLRYSIPTTIVCDSIQALICGFTTMLWPIKCFHRIKMCSFSRWHCKCRENLIYIAAICPRISWSHHCRAWWNLKRWTFNTFTVRKWHQVHSMCLYRDVSGL